MERRAGIFGKGQFDETMGPGFCVMECTICGLSWCISWPYSILFFGSVPIISAWGFHSVAAHNHRGPKSRNDVLYFLLPLFTTSLEISRPCSSLQYVADVPCTLPRVVAADAQRESVLGHGKLQQHCWTWSRPRNLHLGR